MASVPTCSSKGTQRSARSPARRLFHRDADRGIDCGIDVASLGLDGTAWRRYYVLRDCVQHDAGGSSTFAARADDLIIMAGYGFGLLLIEKFLAAHPAVAVAAGGAYRIACGAKPITLGDAEDESPEAQSKWPLLMWK